MTPLLHRLFRAGTPLGAALAFALLIGGWAFAAAAQQTAAQPRAEQDKDAKNRADQPRTADRSAPPSASPTSSPAQKKVEEKPRKQRSDRDENPERELEEEEDI